MSEPFIGQILIFGFNFPPRGWAQCDGQPLPIAQNTALFSLLGTTYGGDGRTNFRLPDLRGRNPIHEGAGPGLPGVALGAAGGATERTLSVANLPAHSHGFQIDCNSEEGNTDNPEDAYPSVSNEDVYIDAPDSTMASMTTQNTGSSAAFNTQDPYLALNFCIALTGVFPSRS